MATFGAAAPRLRALSGIASPVVPTGTTRLRSWVTADGAAEAGRVRDAGDGQGARGGAPPPAAHAGGGVPVEPPPRSHDTGAEPPARVDPSPAPPRRRLPSPRAVR